MGEGAPQGFTPRRQWEGIGEDDGIISERCLRSEKEIIDIVKKCKKNAKKCKNICIYQKKAVSLHRIWE